jgi:rhodanese-related sulfurtransferase
MRTKFFLMIAWPLSLAWGASAAPAISVADLQKLLAQSAPVTVIDVRTPSYYAKEHIPGAINIPATVCPLKTLPPLGQVVVYGDGLVKDDETSAAEALAAKPGIQVDILTGGYAAWQSAQGQTTRGAGLKRETFNYITYDQLKTSKKNPLLLDLRRPPATGAPALTDLDKEFPGLKQVHSHAEAMKTSATTPSPVVLIDDGDGTAEKEARLLKLGGNHNYVILAGGELILSRHGQAGLQRVAAAFPIASKPAPGGKK